MDHISSFPEAKGVVSVDYHYHYVDFATYGQPQPFYINTVREPVSRLLSQYDYARRGPRSAAKIADDVRHYGDKSIEECLVLYMACNCTGNCHHNIQVGGEGGVAGGRGGGC